MHLTLKFIGEVQGTAVPEIQRVLHSIRHKSLAAQLTSLSLFGNSRDPKVIYVDVDCPQLQNLAHILDDAFKDFCEPEKRAFKSHLTIIRVRKAIDSERFLQWLEQTYINPLPFVIDHLSLIESRLNSDGPVHTLIERYELIP